MARTGLQIAGIGVIAAAFLATSMPVWSSEKGPRLKYRSKGSTCACSSGLGEAEISKAMAKLDRLQDPGEEARPNTANIDTQPPRRTADETTQ